MNEKYIKTTLDLLGFIQESPSCYHVVDNVASLLEAEGSIALDEKKRFNLKAGNTYYVSRNNSSIIAFRIPETEVTGFSIIAAHTDAPCFKIKGNPEVLNGNYTTLNVEAYGGMLLAPWFDRPLSIAGRVFIKDSDGQIKQKLVNLDQDLCQIVNLCIHQNRDANKAHDYNVQKEMLPLFGASLHKGALRTLVAISIGVDLDDIIDTELFLYNRQKGSIWGIRDEFFSSPKIDDLQCLYSALKAFISVKESNTSKIQVAAFFDNEEVGSRTKQGADGDFLSEIIARINFSMGYDYEKQCILKANSFMLSADNGHAMHPNYLEKCDITSRPVINDGVLIKYAGNQKYTTDSQSASYLKDIFEKNKIPYQEFFNNSSVTGGSTLGNLAMSHYSIPCVDIGASQLAMHSPYETAGTMDTYYLIEGMKAFYKE